MVNPQESLKILYNFNDFQAYKNIFQQKIQRDNSGSTCFLEHPKTREEI